MIYNQVKNHSSRLCKRFISTKQQQVKDKFSQFRLQIETNEALSSSRSSLEYLNSIFGAFQNLIHVPYVDRNVLCVYWDRDLDLNEVKQVRQSLSYVNNHRNFQQLKLTLLDNLDRFTVKEIALIVKMYRTLDPNSGENTLIQRLNDYCVENVRNFDLQDLDHLSVAYKRDGSAFYKASVDHVYENLINYNIYFTHCDSIKPSVTPYEQRMSVDDVENDYLWLKLNVFRRYSDIMSQTLVKTFLKNTFELSMMNLHDNRQSTFYKINFFVSLFSCLATKGVFPVNTSHMKEFKENYLDEFMSNLDMIEWKLDMKNVFNFLRMNDSQLLKLDPLVDYFSAKLKSEKLTKIEFFQYLDSFNDLIVGKISLPKQNRELIHYLQEKYPTEAALTRFITHKHFLMNLDDTLKQAIARKYDRLIESVDGFCLPLLKSSYNVIHNVHYRPNEALKSLHRKLLQYAEHDTCLDIVSSFASVLVIASDKSTKEYELELSELVSKHTQVMANAEVNTLTIIILNAQSFIENFSLVLTKLRIIVNTASVADMLSVFYLFNKHFCTLLEHNKEATLSLCELFYKKLVNDFNSSSSELNKIESRNAVKLFLKTLKQAKTSYYTGSITFDEYRRIFNEAKVVRFVMETHEFDTQRKYMSTHERVAYLSDLLSHSRYYSVQNLDNLFSYLCSYIRFDLANNVTSEDSFLDSYLHTLRVFKVFNYENVAKMEEFKELNGRFYKKYRHLMLAHEPRILGYASTLINLNCHIDILFDDISARYLSYLSTPKLFEKSEFLFSIILYLAINNRNEKNYLKYKIESVFQRPNKRYFNDFLEFLRENYAERFTVNYVQESRGLFKLELENRVELVQVVLIDKDRCYENSPNEIVRYLDYNLKCLHTLQIPLIIIKEHEFYSNHFKNIFKEKISNKNF